MASPDASKVYDGTALTNTAATQSGFVAGEGVTFSVTGTITDPGSTPNTFTYEANKGTDLANYTIAETTGTLTVTKSTAAITITANSNNKTYDGTALTDEGYAYTQGVLAQGDVLTAVVSGSQTSAGESANTVTSYKVMRGESDVTANYTFAESVAGKLTVEKAILTITAIDNGKMVGQADPALTYTYIGNIAGEVPDFSGALTRVAGETAGTYAINQGDLAATSSSTFKSANYNVEYVPGAFTIASDAGALGVTKTLNNKGTGTDGAFKVGEIAQFTITVTNNSAYDIAGITVQDVLSNATGAIVINPGSGYTVSGTTATIAKLVSKATITITASYKVTQADIDAAKSISNIATATVPGGTDPVPTDPVPVPTDPSTPAATTAKTITNAGTGANGAFLVGETANFNITVTNTGNTTLNDVRVAEALEGATILMGTGYTIVDGAAVISTLAPGATATVQATYTVTQADVDAGGTTNIAAVTTGDPGIDPQDPEIPIPTPDQNPSYTTAKTITNTPANGTAFAAGETANFNITVTNTGNTTLTNVHVTDAMTGLDTYIDSVAPGATATVTTSYTVTQADVDAQATLTNVAVVTPSNPGTTPENPSAIVPVTPPVTPPTPTPVTPTPTPTPTTPVDAIVTPVATALQNAVQVVIGETPTPLATPEEELAEDGTPLGAFDEPVCWVHWYILLGIIITTIYGAGVLVRRRHYRKTLESREKDVLGETEEEESSTQAAPTMTAGKEA